MLPSAVVDGCGGKSYFVWYCTLVLTGARHVMSDFSNQAQNPTQRIMRITSSSNMQIFGAIFSSQLARLYFSNSSKCTEC